MSEDMVERVARAIWAERSRRVAESCDVPALHLWAWEDENEYQRESVRLEARAAIAAMREPTEAMVTAWRTSDATPGMYYDDIFKDHWWPAAIDSALSPTKE